MNGFMFELRACGFAVVILAITANSDCQERLTKDNRSVSLRFSKVPIAEVVGALRGCGFAIDFEDVGLDETKSFRDPNGDIICRGDSIQSGVIEGLPISKSLDRICELYPKFCWRRSEKSQRLCVYPRQRHFGHLKFHLDKATPLIDVVARPEFRSKKMHLGCDDYEGEQDQAIIGSGDHVLHLCLDRVADEQKRLSAWEISWNGGICFFPIPSAQDAPVSASIQFNIGD